jgi:hypothetical protein
MPTLLVIEGFRFYFFSNERREPPHVHVRRGDGVAKLAAAGADRVRKRLHPAPGLRRTRQLTFEHQGLLLRKVA